MRMIAFAKRYCKVSNVNTHVRVCQYVPAICKYLRWQSICTTTQIMQPDSRPGFVLEFLSTVGTGANDAIVGNNRARVVCGNGINQIWVIYDDVSTAAKEEMQTAFRYKLFDANRQCKAKVALGGDRWSGWSILTGARCLLFMSIERIKDIRNTTP